MTKIITSATGLCVCLLVFFSCQKLDYANTTEAVLQLPEQPYQYDSASGNNYIPTLGRVLFYDPRVSVNNALSCATCHKQAMAFADNVAFSAGYEGKLTFRNSMPIQNLMVEGVVGGNVNDMSIPGLVGTPIVGDSLSLFWDGRSKILKKMVLQPIANHVEMGITDLDALAVKISKIPDYQGLFFKAYGTTEVTQEKIADALSAFLINITSSQSAFDQHQQIGVAPLNQTPTMTMSTQELRGMDLFENKYNCNSCHQVTALNGYQLGGGFVNIGLEKNYTDVGFADVTQKSTDIGKFKIPTLRNIMLTAPYMHDGRFKTLDDVIEHYSSGIVDHPNLDQRLKVGDAPLRMNITDTDKKSLIAFLSTLTDYKMITDPRFSNPFVTKQK